MENERVYRKHSYAKGQQFGRLTLTGSSYLKEMYGQQRRIVEAECDCGTIRGYLFGALIKGETKSCGCFRKEVSKHLMTTHGLSKHPLYEVHQAMRKRCYVPQTTCYDDYGGRGIGICDQWVDDFVCFYDWAVENGYQSDLSLERRDNNKGYSPENCYWATRKIQNRNTRRNKLITAFGETKCLFDWGVDERCKIGVWGLRNRHDRGKWTDMEAMISSPAEDKIQVARNNKRAIMITAFGETKCMTAWLEDERCLVKLDSLRDRYKKGWDGEKILTTPPSSSGKAGIKNSK